MLEQMQQNMPLDVYTVTIQRYDSEEMAGQFRALAKRKRDKALVEALLSSQQIKGLLRRALGRHDFVTEAMNMLDIEGQIDVLIDPKRLAQFTSDELIMFGFHLPEF
jgi:hypothetical protein